MKMINIQNVRFTAALVLRGKVRGNEKTSP